MQNFLSFLFDEKCITLSTENSELYIRVYLEDMIAIVKP